MRKCLTLALVYSATMAGIAAAPQWATPRIQAIFPDHVTVQLEVADTEAKRQRGLMFRPGLEPGNGMLFVFDEPGSHPFWMQNCLISIDIIWLDEEGRVADIAASVPPCRLPACEPPCNSNSCPTYPHAGRAKYVIEVVAGFADAHGLKKGDRVQLVGSILAR